MTNRMSDEQVQEIRELPDIEVVSDRVHEAWRQQKLLSGITSRKSERGEELLVPYDNLSEPAKELDRATVRAVYEAIALSPRCSQEKKPEYTPDIRAASQHIQRLFDACGDGAGKLDAGWVIVVATKALEALSEGIAESTELTALRAELKAEREKGDKLQAFKTYVHARLDAMGIPADPESPHKAEGCRIGGRLDLIDSLAKENGELSEALVKLQNSACAALAQQKTGDADAPSDLRWMNAKVGDIVKESEMNGGKRYVIGYVECCDMPTMTFKNIGDGMWQRIE